MSLETSCFEWMKLAMEEKKFRTFGYFYEAKDNRRVVEMGK
jgi:hypothetical protein